MSWQISKSASKYLKDRGLFIFMKLGIKEWIEKAETDLALAIYDLKGDFYEDACFHAHQCAEKSLKAPYIKKFDDLLKIHDLKTLAQKLNAPDNIIDIGDSLNPYYINSRYPGFDESPSEFDAKEAIENAKKVLTWVKKLI